MLLIVPAILSCMLCAVLVVLLLPAMRRYALARPNARSSHTIPTPQGAGIAILLSTLIVATLALRQVEWPSTSNWQWALLGSAIVLIAAVGVWDDIASVAVLPRLVAQGISIILMVASLPLEPRLIPFLTVSGNSVLLVVAALWFVNLVNFMDGLDLLTVSAMVPLSAAIALFAFTGIIDTTVGIVAATLCGALIAFSFFNKPVAKVFLGDVGSLPIGLIVAWLLFHIAQQTNMTAAILLPLYHCADATTTLIRRIWRKEKIWQAHRTHYYQRATDNGYKPIEIAGILFCIHIFLAIFAWVCATQSSLEIQALAFIAGVMVVGTTLVRFNMPRAV